MTKAKMPVEIRPPMESDRDAWEGLWTAYLEFYNSSASKAVYDQTFARLIKSVSSNINGLIALIDGRPVGLVHYIFHDHCWRLEQVCYLQDLFTAPEARGHGVGRALIEAVYDAADAAGCPSVYWMTQDFNADARVLYDRIGQLTPFIKYQRPA